MKLMVMGHARHGKDTVGELLRDEYGLRFTSSSLFCAERIVMPLFGDKYETVQACFDDRGNHRELWHKAIADFCEKDLSALGTAIFAENDIYCGIRSNREFHACKAAGIFHFSVFVDASMRRALEPRTSMKIEPWMADFVLDNNGTPQQLREGVHRLMNNIYGRMERNAF